MEGNTIETINSNRIDSTDSYLGNIIDINRFRLYKVALYGNQLAIATYSHLIISDLVFTKSESRTNTLHVVYSFDYRIGLPSALIWLSTSLICIGFESGTMICVTTNGDVVTKFPCNDGSIQSFKISSNVLEGFGSPSLWILYETGVFRVVSVVYKYHSLYTFKYFILVLINICISLFSRDVPTHFLCTYVMSPLL